MATSTLDTRPRAAASGIFGPVEGVLTYISPVAGKPHTYHCEPPAGTARQNFHDDAHTVTVADLRGRETDFTLGRHGFEPVVHQSRETRFDASSCVLSCLAASCTRAGWILESKATLPEVRCSPVRNWRQTSSSAH
jgi:hypothetical protein